MDIIMHVNHVPKHWPTLALGKLESDNISYDLNHN
jgi:hypothetical protein